MEKYSLTNDNIVNACENVENSLANFQVDRREALRIKLMLEEVLIFHKLWSWCLELFQPTCSNPL